ncbi:uncharacterized protein LOC131612285 isoform X2 [Vicia villosa]|uniref:uncharacterized protein LOC131612285 isoform X2 n=1 Tax=Vicia villosa TaxID=3911 RepID=UPI00273B0841|nr:uncharacterized protein LOC131612285 isoform X2 [Vicia villosa]
MITQPSTSKPTSLSTTTLLPHSPPPTLQPNSPKRKREMCEPPQQITTLHSPSTLFQIHPTTPEKSTRFSPNSNPLNNNCFKCHQPGHWASVCPLKSSTNTNSKPHSNSSASKQIHCRCGHGFCDVKMAHSDKNNGRYYFLCPIKRGARCSTFVKWCDDPINESDLQPPLIKYPACECGAGVCRKVMETEEGSCRVKSYFACPIKQSHGSCGFRVWEDELLNTASIDELVNNTGVVPIRQSKQRSLNELFKGDQTDTDTAVNDPPNDLADGSDLLLTTKRMRITDSSENPSPVSGSEILEGKSGESSIEEASSQYVGFPEIEFEDDPESINLASWAAIEAEAFLSSRMTTPSRISCRQSLFQSDMLAADASLGIFPSLDPIEVPKQTSTLNSQSERNDLAIKTPNQSTQLSTDVVSLDRSQGSDSQLKARRQREVALFTQQRLLKDLEDLDFHQHESMREAAEATFSMLYLLGFECKRFSDYVWNFINLATSMAEIDESMKNSPTLEDHIKFLEEEKARQANIKDDCMKTEALLGSSNQKRNLLREEIARLEAMVIEKRNELKICELETVNVETQLDNLKIRMLEVDVTVKDKVRQAEAARKQIAEKDRKQIEAMAALEKAKHELVN